MQSLTMKVDSKSLEELIRKQPPPSSERFWQQVEKAKGFNNHQSAQMNANKNADGEG
jgi:hypothetical protein